MQINLKIQDNFKKDGSPNGYIAKNVYFGICSVSGNQARTDIVGQSRSEVKRKAKTKEEQFKNNGNTFKKKSTLSIVSELVDHWFTHQYSNEDVKPITVKATERRIRLYIKPLLGSYKFDQLKPILMQTKVNEFISKNKDRLQQYSLVLSTIKRIFDYGVSMQCLAVNPMVYVTLPKARKKKSTNNEVDHYNWDVILKIKDKLSEFTTYNDEVFAFCINMLIHTGMRIGEVLALAWDDIDLDNRTISINKTVTNNDKDIGSPKSVAGNRVIAIDSCLIEVIKDFHKKQNAEHLRVGVGKKDIVFYNIGTGKWWRYSRISARFKRFCVMHNFEYLKGVHCFRHSYATRFIEVGGNPKNLQYRLGHEKIEMTMNLYVKYSPENEAKTNENMFAIAK